MNIDRVVGMGAAIDDIHHRHRQGAGRCAAHITIEGQTAAFRRRLGHREADAENRVGAKAGFVGRAVKLDHRRVDSVLLGCVGARERLEKQAIDRFDRLLHALAVIPALVAVAQFDSFMRAGAGARRHRGAAEGAVLKGHVHLDGRIASTVENFAGGDVDNRAHAGDPLSRISYAWRGDTAAQQR